MPAAPPATARRSWTIAIPGWHPARLNQLLGGHWSRGARLKAQDRRIVALGAHMARVPEATGKRRVALKITLGPRQRAADPDAYWKSLLDALANAGLLIDDNRQGVELAPVEYDRGPAKAATITLTDL